MQVLTHVKKELLHIAVGIFLLQIHVAKGIHDQNLAVLGHDPLLRAAGAGSLSLRHGRRASASLLGGTGSAAGLASALLGGLLTRSLLLHPTLLAVHRHRGLVIVGGGRRRRGRCGRRGIDAGDPQVAAPGGLARERDVAANELALPLPAHVQGEVVEAAAAHKKHTDEHGAQPRPVPAVVVLGALPHGEAVGDEVVVARAARAPQDVRDDGEAGLAVASGLDGGLDLGLRRRLRYGDAGFLAALVLLGGLRALGG